MWVATDVVVLLSAAPRNGASIEHQASPWNLKLVWTRKWGAKQTACDLHPILSGTNHATHATPSRDGRFGHHSGDHGIEFHAHSLSLFPGSAAGAAALKYFEQCSSELISNIRNVGYIRKVDILNMSEWPSELSGLKIWPTKNRCIRPHPPIPPSPRCSSGGILQRCCKGKAQEAHFLSDFGKRFWHLPMAPAYGACLWRLPMAPASACLGLPTNCSLHKPTNPGENSKQAIGEGTSIRPLFAISWTSKREKSMQRPFGWFIDRRALGLKMS